MTGLVYRLSQYRVNQVNMATMCDPPPPAIMNYSPPAIMNMVLDNFHRKIEEK